MSEEETPKVKKKTGNKPKQLVDIPVSCILVGRDKTPVDPKTVRQLAGIGCKDTEISDWFGVDANSLRYNFKVELLKGREELRQSLRRAMLHNAINNNNAALQIFLAKNFLGMSDNPTNGDDNKILPWENALEEKTDASE